MEPHHYIKQCYSGWKCLITSLVVHWGIRELLLNLQINTRTEGLQAFWRIKSVFKAVFINLRNEQDKCKDILIRTRTAQVGTMAAATGLSEFCRRSPENLSTSWIALQPTVLCHCANNKHHLSCPIWSPAGEVYKCPRLPSPLLEWSDPSGTLCLRNTWIN